MCHCEVTFWRLEQRTKSSTGLNISSSWISAFLAESVCPAFQTLQVSEGKLLYRRLQQSLTASRVSAPASLLRRNSQKPTVHTFFSYGSITSVNGSLFSIWTFCSIYLAVKLDILIITGGLFLTRSSQTFSTRVNLKKKKIQLE